MERCCFCNRQMNWEIEMNDPRPIVSERGKYCCNECNRDIVIPTRIKLKGE